MTASKIRRLALITLLSIAGVPAAQSAEFLTLSPGFAKSVTVNGAVAGKFTAIVGNPKIADVTFGPKNKFWFVGLAEGTTNVIVLDNDTGNEMYNAIIQVGEPGRMHIHNKNLVTSYTVYRCTPICAYVSEVTSSEQALPRGYSQSTYQSSIQANTTQAPTTVLPLPTPQPVQP